MKAIAIVLLCAATAFGQAKKATPPKPAAPAATAPAAAPAPAPKPAADIVVPKESVDSLKLQLAMEKQKSIQEQAQALQQQAMQAIEPRMAPLRTEYQAQLEAGTKEEQVVRKENGWGPDIELDKSIGSSTYGQWVKKKAEAKK